MSASVPPPAASPHPFLPRSSLRLAFLGSPGWLDSCSPAGVTGALRALRRPIIGPADVGPALADVQRFAPHVTVVFDPLCLPAEALSELPGTSLGIIVGDIGGSEEPLARAAGALDRVLSFRPGLTGAELGSVRIWRAIPPPVNDALFGEVRPLHGPPLTMTIGRATEHREYLLLPAKHHHDVLQIIHGVTGETLVALLREYDVGIYAPPEPDGGFGPQVGMHLAAGQLLFATELLAQHGLEPGIDYIPFDSPQGLVWDLDRLARFPEMHQRQRVRGRMKAEGYRASRLFARVAHDLIADVAAFGAARAAH